MGIKPGKREQKSELQKQKIKEAALALFREYGFSSVTVNDICNEVGISVGSFYNFYSSKENLLYICVHVLRDDFLEKNLCLNDEQSFDEMLEHFFEVNAKYNMSIPKKLLGEAYGAWVSARTAHDTNPQRTLHRYIKQLVQQGQRERYFFLDYTEERMSVLLNTIVTGLAISWCGGLYDEDTYLCFSRDMARMLIHTMKTK